MPCPNCGSEKADPRDINGTQTCRQCQHIGHHCNGVFRVGLAGKEHCARCLDPLHESIRHIQLQSIASSYKQIQTEKKLDMKKRSGCIII
jgi:hypothetical protein